MTKSKKQNETKAAVVIAGYIRVSTARQAFEGDSLEAQQRAIEMFAKHWAEKEGCAYELRLFVDRGRSAKNQNRPQLMALKASAEAGVVDVVVTGKLDRITRSLDDFVALWAFFKDHGVQLVSVQENFDTSTATGEAMLYIIMVFAQLERKLTGERTTETMQDRTRRGLWNGGYVLGYACNDETKLVLDADTAPVVKQVFHDFERLGSVGKVVTHHREIGTRMPKRKNRAGKPIGGKPLSKQQVSRMLQNRVYLGEVQWGGVCTPNAHEPIIDVEQFQRVQVLLDRNRVTRTNPRQETKRVFRLKGLVRCGCGAMMTPKNCTGRNGKHSYYVCTAKSHTCGGQCDAPYQPAVALEQAVIERLSQLSRDEPARERIITDAMNFADDERLRIAKEMDSVDRRIASVNGEIGSLVGVLKERGSAGLASVKDELKALESENKELTDKKNEFIQQLSKLSGISEEGRRFIYEWKNVAELLGQAETEEQATLLQHLIEVIEIDPPVGDTKAGAYRLKLSSDHPDDDQPLPQETTNPPDDDTGADSSVLTRNGAVLQVDEKAPRDDAQRNFLRGDKSGSFSQKTRSNGGTSVCCEVRMRGEITSKTSVSAKCRSGCAGIPSVLEPARRHWLQTSCPPIWRNQGPRQPISIGSPASARICLLA